MTASMRNSSLHLLALSIGVALLGCGSMPAVPADAAPDAETPQDGGADAAPDTVPVDAGTTPRCDPNATWGTPQGLGLGSPADVFGSVTPDERTIAWIDGAGHVLWSDRASASDPWSAPAQVTVQGGVETDRVALSPDGLRLVFVVPGRRAFAELTRATRSDPFGDTPEEGKFATINLTLGESPASQKVGDPVLGADDLTFAFSFWDDTSTDSIRIASRASTSELWPLGQPHGEVGLGVVAGKRRRPTGLSSDLRTLFVWDESRGEERAAFRGEDRGDFTQFVSLANRPLAQPNFACSRLYGGATVDVAQGGLGMASSTKQ
jgi:hypothetical protein